MESDREAFLKAIAAAPWDDELQRGIYADWLDERGEHDEADRQRQHVTSERWLREFARKCGKTCTNYGAISRAYVELTRDLDSHSQEYIDTVKEIESAENWADITYEDVVRAGHDYIQTGDYFTQQGAEGARDLMSDRGTREGFWRHWRIVTGRQTPDKIEWWPGEFGDFDDDCPFSCSC